MTSDPPKSRPVERFWPYAELPEQPTEEELASLDPDLHEALFGAQPRPFSITLVFPPLDLPDFPAALEIARASAEYRETGAGTTFTFSFVGKAGPRVDPPANPRAHSVA